MADASQNSRSAELVIASIATVAIAGIVVALRFATRLRILKFLGNEDICIGIAYVLSIGNTIGMYYQAKFALGRHVTTLSPEHIKSELKAYMATLICYGISLVFTKISILLQYIRIFKVRELLIACYTLIAIITVWGVEVFIAAIFACWPIPAFWDLTIKDKKCVLNTPPVWFTNVAINIATDLMIFMMPIPVIRGLNLPTRQKTALLGVFLLGFFVCIVSILRIPSLQKAAVSKDFSYDNIGIAIWSCVEINVAIICACLPTLKPLVSRFFPGLLSTGKQTSRSNYLRYGSNADVTHHRNTWKGSKMSRADHTVNSKTVNDSESGTGIVTVDEDFILESLDLETRKDGGIEEIRTSTVTEMYHKSQS